MKIDIRDGIPDDIALQCVHLVVSKGRVSKGEKGRMYYCWATLISTTVGDVWVLTRQYRKNDCFLVYKDRTNEQE